MFLFLNKGNLYAEVAESADALDSGSSECKFMRVQVPSSAPNKTTDFDTRSVVFHFTQKP